MNVPLQLKQITQHTTQVAFSTSFLLGGCVVAGRDEEIPDTVDVDAGDDAIIEAVHYGQAEAASHEYHEPDAPVVMPLEMEDAPTTLPPPAAMSAPREPKERRGKQHHAGRHERDEDCEQVHADAVSAASRTRAAARAAANSNQVEADEAPARAVEKKTVEKAKRDPVAESFLHTQGGSSSYQLRSTGTRY